MSSLAEAYGLTQAAQDEAAAKRERLCRAYQAVFDGTPRPTMLDRRLVLEDLELFCGMRTNLMREKFSETANAIGTFRVWQRIHGFRFPRPADAATNTGGTDGREQQQHEPIRGGGVAEPTED